MNSFYGRWLERVALVLIGLLAAVVIIVLVNATPAPALPGLASVALLGVSFIAIVAATVVVLAMRSRLSLVQEALDTTNAAIAVYDSRDRLVMGNERYREVLDVPPEIFKPGAAYVDLVHTSLQLNFENEEDLERELQKRLSLHRAADGQPSDRKYPNDHWRRVTKTRTKSGANIGIAIDVTDYYSLRDEADREARRFEILANNAPVGICQISQSNSITFYNRAFLTIFQLSDIDLIYSKLLDISANGKKYRTFSEFTEALSVNSKEIEINWSINNELKYAIVKFASIGAEAYRGYVQNEIILILINITKRKRAEARVSYFAHHDALTGAKNRLSFNQDIQTAARRASKTCPVCIISIDLDQFKPVNDTYGHHTGDEILRMAVARLSTLLEPGMDLYRMGGDEFTIIRSMDSTTSDPLTFAQSLVEAMSLPFEINEKSITIGASAGVSLIPRDANNTETLVHCADQALYMAKKRGGGDAVSY
ncbi:diguanylate cyclase [Acuticoccus sp. MNP-M23]|uniref:diguanylate cyclase domain-containing protein n=1 Tax=Acuticoccus sp. MNP-M23 TaxID=3072793 RepID=UPI0028166FD8|nr:diguanylate cyclase [Acuticoccus sp. MNP-M23]WMS43893.1 diguanylate cyclase [Acuticoccus sp. MNP-M23]